MGNQFFAGLFGSTDGSLSDVGKVGELIEATQTAALGSGFVSAQFGNVTTITLSPGDWSVTAIGDNAFLASVTRVVWAISTFTGNTTTDHVTGVNVQDSNLGVTGAVHGNVTIANYTVNVAASTQIFFKCQLTGAVGNVITGRLSARRMR